jgi:Phage integrase SAM-like domain
MAHRAKKPHIYVRGDYWLDWDRRKDGTFRTKYLAIFWYDGERGRIRSLSTRTSDIATAKSALDKHYLTTSKGEAICPTCGQRRLEKATAPLLTVISDYLALNEDHANIGSIRPRLAHVVNYVASLPNIDVRSDEVDKIWAERFRTWLSNQPVMTTAGNVRTKPRSLSTIENSLIQLAAAINAAEARKDIAHKAKFKPTQTKELNQTPQRRLNIEALAAAFSYATDSRYPEKRRNLHRFLILSVGTVARPDAVHEFSTAQERRQWNPDRGIVALNPAGRRQTKKRRPIVVAPLRLAMCINGAEGRFVPCQSAKSAWETMVSALGWPRDGEGGMKLIRRSVAQLRRDAGTSRGWSAAWKDSAKRVPSNEISMQLGHSTFDAVTDLYAAFDPDYLATVTAAINGIMDAIESLCPDAFKI